MNKFTKEDGIVVFDAGDVTLLAVSLENSKNVGPEGLVDKFLER